MTYSHEKQVAIEAVTQAAALCQDVRTEIVSVGSLQKDDRSPVTIADFGAQALVCRHLMKAFEQDVIVGEEDSGDLQKSENASVLAQVTQYAQRYQSDATPDSICAWIDAGNGTVAERFWTLDPIDGTKGFLRNDQYAIALALIEDRQVKVAALGCPALQLDINDPQSKTGIIFVAVQGQGAEMGLLGGDSMVPIQVMSETDGARMRFVQSVEASHGDSPLQRAVAQAAGISHAPLRMDSQVKYAAIARGDAALYLRLPSPRTPDYREKIWDHAAGCLLVEEAGGRVTDMNGQPLDLYSDYKMNDNRGVIASNGTLHTVALAALAQR